MAYDKLQILAGTFLPFFISFNTVLAAVASTELDTKHKKNELKLFRGGFFLNNLKP